MQTFRHVSPSPAESQDICHKSVLWNNAISIGIMLCRIAEQYLLLGTTQNSGILAVIFSCTVS